MKKIMGTLFVIGLLTGCSEVDEATDNIENETEEITDKVGQAVIESEKELESLVNELNTEVKENMENLEQSIVTEGEHAFIDRDLLLPLTEEHYENLYGYIEETEYEKINNMLDSGDVIYVEENTKVEVIDVDVRQATVRLTSTDEEGYVPVFYLTGNENS